MTTKKNKDLEQITHFEKKTYRQVTLWDWAARIAPMTVLLIVLVCYFFNWHNAMGLVLEAAAIVFAIVCFIWWYWAIYKIAVTVKYMRESQEKFVSLSEELRKFKSALKRNDSDSNR